MRGAKGVHVSSRADLGVGGGDHRPAQTLPAAWGYCVLDLPSQSVGGTWLGVIVFHVSSGESARTEEGKGEAPVLRCAPGSFSRRLQLPPASLRSALARGGPKWREAGASSEATPRQARL